MRKVLNRSVGVFALLVALVGGVFTMSASADPAPVPVPVSASANPEPGPVPASFTLFVGACQMNGRAAASAFIKAGEAPIPTAFVHPVRVFDPQLVVPDSVATDIQPSEPQPRSIPLWVKPDGIGLSAGTWRVDLYADAEHTQLLATTPTQYVPKCDNGEPAPEGDHPPGWVPPGGGTVRPPDATGDLQVLSKGKHQAGSKVRMSWDATGIVPESKFKLMIQPPKMKTLTPIFKIGPGVVGSKLVKYRHQKRLPKGTRLKLWVHHYRIDTGEWIWVCLDQVTVGKKRSGC